MSAIERSTTIFRADMQICPWWRNDAERRRVHGVVEVGVVEDDQRVVAAELEHDALEVAAGSLGELASGLRGAREVDAPDRRVLDELVGDRPRLPGSVRDDVQDASREARFGEDLAPERARP